MSAPQKTRVDDDDDLDDLDDVLDQFTPAPPKPSTSASTSTSHPSTSQSPASASLSASASTSTTKSTSSIPVPPPPPSTATIPASFFPPVSDDEGDGVNEDLDSEFAKELQRGMESLMHEMAGLGAGGVDRDVLEGMPSLSGGAGKGVGDGNAGTGAETGAGKTEKEKERDHAFKAAWEAMLVEGMDGMVGSELKPEALPAFGGGSGARKEKTKETSGDGKKQDFQAGIRAAMDKLKSSESGFKDGSSSSANPNDPLEAFFSQLDAASLGEEGEDGEENEEEMQGMLEMMMGSLMSKDVLYEPLKELGDKFPSYLSENATKLSAEEKTRYESQLDRITKIVNVFEDPKYSDEDKEKTGEVVELMGQMQSFGSPPTEIMGDLPPGFNLGPDGMPQVPEGCCIS